MKNIIIRSALFVTNALLLTLCPFYVIWVILGAIVSFAFEFNPYLLLEYFSFGFVGYLAFCLIAPVFSPIFVMLMGARPPINKETQVLMPSLTEVMSKCKYKKKVSVSVIDNMLTLNAQAINNCIVFTTGMINNSSENELKGVMAHEMSHVINKDSYFSVVVTFLNYPYMFFGWIASGVKNVGQKIPICYIFLLPFLPFLLVFYPLESFLVFCYKSASRSSEFRADQFAFTNGYGEGLISVLEQFQSQETSKSFFMAMTDTHPSPSKRILRLEQLLNQDN